MYGSITDKINYHLLKDEVEKLYSTLPVSYIFPCTLKLPTLKPVVSTAT